MKTVILLSAIAYVALWPAAILLFATPPANVAPFAWLVVAIGEGVGAAILGAALLLGLFAAAGDTVKS